MATPTMITINGDLNPAFGATQVAFRVPTPIRYNAGPDVLLPQTVLANVSQVDGTFTIDVPASNDPSWSPANWTYEITIVGPNLNYSFVAQIPVDVSPLNFSSILPAQSASLGTLYAAFNHTHDGGGGGGGGGTPSSSVVSGTSFGAAQTAGVATTYSRGDHSHGTPAAPTAASIGAATTGHNHTGTYDPAGTAASAVAAHEADTTSVHGIANTANLVLTNDSRLSDARTPAAHAASHADGGSDEVSLDGSQVTTGTVAFARLPTGTGGTQVALGNHNHTGVYQPLDSDLTTIAGLTATTDNVIQSVAGAWAARTPTQLKSTLALVSSDVGLGNVTNTSDANKPVSTAQQAALDLKADLASPALTGNPTAPTQTAGNNSTRLATTAFVTAAIAGAGGGTAPTFARGVVTAGDVVPTLDASWTLLSAGLGTWSLAAAVGDDVELEVSCMIQDNTSSFYEVVLVVSGAIVRFGSTRTSSPTGAGEGDPVLYPNTGFGGHITTLGFTVVSGDLDAGNVVFTMAHKGAAAGKLFASTNYPLRWRIRNDH